MTFPSIRTGEQRISTSRLYNIKILCGQNNQHTQKKKKLTGGPALKQCISQMQKIDNHGMWIRVYLNYSPLSLSLSLSLCFYVWGKN